MKLRHWLAQRTAEPHTEPEPGTLPLSSDLRGSPASLLPALLDTLNEGVLAVDHAQQIIYLNTPARHLLGIHDTLPLSADHLPTDRVLRDALAAAGRGISTEATELTHGERTLSVTARSLGDGVTALMLSELTHIRRLEAVRRDFVANVSHELRTPLTVISGFAETLNDADASLEERQRFASMILANTHRMQRIVDELLDLSRIESGGWVPQPFPVDIRETATDTIAECQESALNKNVMLTTEIAPNARIVYADRTALRQVLGNLIENAIRHTTEGCITVATSHDPEQGGVWVHVRDTGIGIAPEHLPRIFERFYRVDTGRDRGTGGTGLGLAIVKHLAEAHGGRVQGESVPNQGTTISAYFPPSPTENTIVGS